MPSTRAQSSATAGASFSVSVKPGFCSCARVHEQLHRLRPRQRLDARASATGTASGSTGYTCSPGTRSASRLDAMIRTSGAARSSALASVGAGAHHLLAVVEDQQRLPRLQVRAQRLGERPARLLAHGEHLRRLVRHERRSRIGARSRNQMPSGYASSMSAAICSDSRVLPRPPMPRSVSRRLPFRSWVASSSSRSRPMNDVSCSRQVVGRRLERAQRREVRAQVADAAPGRRAPAPPGPSAGRCRDRAAWSPAGSRVPHFVDDRLRHQDLAAVGDAHDPRGAIDGRAEVVVVAPLDHAHVQPAADAIAMPLVTAGSTSDCWNATVAFTASSGSSNAAKRPSPVVLTMTPRLPSTAIRARASCWAKAPAMRSPSCSHRRVLPSMSVNRIVVTRDDTSNPEPSQQRCQPALYNPRPAMPNQSGAHMHRGKPIRTHSNGEDVSCRLHDACRQKNASRRLELPSHGTDPHDAESHCGRALRIRFRSGFHGAPHHRHAARFRRAGRLRRSARQRRHAAAGGHRAVQARARRRAAHRHAGDPHARGPQSRSRRLPADQDRARPRRDAHRRSRSDGTHPGPRRARSRHRHRALSRGRAKS